MTDERRQRYAQEIYAAGPMEINGPETIAEAAMAVADEEQREMRAKLFEWQGSYLDEVKVRQEREQGNARLRKELDTANRHLGARRIELLRVSERHAATIEGLSRALARNQMRVERVRAALDFCDRGSAIAIRAALEGES